MKKITLLTLAICIFGHTWGQEAKPDSTKPWKKTKQFGFNINQGSFTNNFTGSSVASSLGIGGFFNAKGDYAKGNIGWVNDLQLKYGILSNKDKGSAASAFTRKSIDMMLFDTKFTKKLNNKWSLAAGGNFLSQFTNSNDLITVAGTEKTVKRSGLFAPAFITESIGFEYKPVPYFNMVISPMALRQTIVSDKNLYLTPGNEKNFGVTPNETFRNELGLFQLVANFDKDIAKDVNLKFRYMGFATIKSFGNIDDRLDANLTAKINKNVNVNLGLIAVYDADQSGKVQLAQSLNFGFLFNL
jgi:hypothetical protein